MGDTAKTLGIGPLIPFEGKEYTVSPLTFTEHGKFEVWMEKRARDVVRRATDVTPEQEIRLLNEVTRDSVAGVYSWGGEVCAMASVSLHGRKELMRISLSKKHPEADHELVDRLFEAFFAETEAAMTLANADPKAEKPAGGDP